MKGFIKKLMLVSTLAVFTVILMTYSFILYFEAVEEEQYKNNASAAFGNVFVSFEDDLYSALDEVNGIAALFEEEEPEEEESEEDEPSGEEPEEEPETFGLFSDITATKEDVLELSVSDGYAGAGYVILHDSNKMADVKFSAFGTVLDLQIDADIYRGFGDTYIMFAGSAGGTRYFFYGKKTDSDISGCDYVVIAGENSPLGRLLDYSFSNYAVIDRQGTVLDLLAENSSIKSLPRGSVGGRYEKYGNKEYLIISKNSESPFGEYSLAGLVNKTDIDDYIGGISLRLYIFLIICCIIMLVFLGAFLAMIRIDKALIGTGEYRIDVDMQGTIKETDKKFGERYKKMLGNISNYLEAEFTQSNIVVKAETMEGERAYLNCKKLIRKNGSNIIFMASDVTDLYNGYLKFKMEHFTDDITEMHNIQQLEIDFNEETGGKNKKTVAFINYELGIEKYWALYGIEFYKRLLKVLADRLSETYVWQAKTFYLTGDRFMIMVTDNIHDVIAKIDSSVEFIGAPVRVDDLIIRAGGKAGYFIYAPKEEELSLSQIISRTELALSYAKNSNKRSNYGYVDSIMRSKQTLSNEDIRQIIMSEEVSVFFQPQYSISKKRIIGFEALTRLSGKYSYINPGAFIENVEQSGAMVMLGDYIMEKAMKFAATLDDKSVKISVNVSPLQLLGEKFVERFISRLNDYELHPNQIGIEVTETYEMSSVAKAREKLRDLQKQGIHIGIDDFGEKYSSLRYIKNLPINSIKIDKGFTDGVEDEKYSRVIVETIVDLAKKLNLYTVIEGVETESQVDTLREIGADIIQGYIVSPAVDENKAREYIESKRDIFGREGKTK